MTINTAMLAGISGLRANASALAAISDNISNVNTIGYKRLRSDFISLLNMENASTTHNAGGVRSTSYGLTDEQGALQSSVLNTHLAISGKGYFTVRENGGDANPTDPFFYTRAGQFAPDDQGFLKNPAGYYLYGWNIDTSGQPLSNPTDLSRLQPVRISNIAGAAEATTTIAYSANLQSSQIVSPAEATYDPVTNNMASGVVIPDFQNNLQIYDSLGGLKNITLSFLKSATPNQWHVEVHVVPSTDVQHGAGLADGQIATGIITFTPDGILDTVNSTLPLTFTIGESSATPGAGETNWVTNLGLAEQVLTLDIGGINQVGGLSQYDTPSILSSASINGKPFGGLAGVEVDQDGYVTATFTNGLTKKIYQLPLADFLGSGGLNMLSGGVYSAGPETANSLNLKVPNTAGAGVIQPRSLESSTVDMAEEFTNLITTQKAYSASSKIISTADEMLDELIRLKR